MSDHLLREDIIARAKRAAYEHVGDLLMMTARNGASERILDEELDYLAGVLRETLDQLHALERRERARAEAEKAKEVKP